MSTYNLTFTFENIRTLLVIAGDIFIMWFVLYYAIKLVSSNSRTIQIFKGILLVIVVDAMAKLLGLTTVRYLTSVFINWGFLAFIIIFQPELRTMLERIGKTNIFSRITTLTGDEKEKLVNDIVAAALLLSKNQTGALISIEQGQSLDEYVATGTKLHSDVTTELLTSIFVTTTPLHDGAVIIQGDKIACASAYFPPTNFDLPSRYGARHRAAIGISEVTDAVTIVISEETGTISVTEGGKIRSLDERQLRDYLLRVICGEETEVRYDSLSRAPRSDASTIVINDDVMKEDVNLEETGSTGVFSKLAIRKQGNTKNNEEHHSSKENNEHLEENDSSHSQRNRKPLFSGFFKPSENHVEAPDEMEAIQKAAGQIKLPKKSKEHVAPIAHEVEAVEPVYKEEPAAVEETPILEEVFETTYSEEGPVVETENVITPIELDTPVESQEPVEPLKPDVTSLEIDTVEETVPQRMTSEQVRQMREATKKKLSTMTEEIETMKNLPNEEMHFDTSKLDVSKIVGIGQELDQQLNMVDLLNTEKSASSDSEGGKH